MFWGSTVLKNLTTLNHLDHDAFITLKHCAHGQAQTLVKVLRFGPIRGPQHRWKNHRPKETMRLTEKELTIILFDNVWHRTLDIQMNCLDRKWLWPGQNIPITIPTYINIHLVNKTRNI